MTALEHEAAKLQAHHAILDATLADELRRPLPDQGILNQVRVQKLRAKDRLERLKQQRAA